MKVDVVEDMQVVKPLVYPFETNHDTPTWSGGIPADSADEEVFEREGCTEPERVLRQNGFRHLAGLLINR